MPTWAGLKGSAIPPFNYLLGDLDASLGALLDGGGLLRVVLAGREGHHEGEEGELAEHVGLEFGGGLTCGG